MCFRWKRGCYQLVTLVSRKYVLKVRAPAPHERKPSERAIIAHLPGKAFTIGLGI